MGIERPIIRWNLDLKDSRPALDIATGELAWFFRGGPVGFGINLLKENVLQSIDELALLTLEIRPAEAITGGPIMTGSLGPDDFSEVESPDHKSNAQALFEFSGSETALDLGTGNPKREFLATVKAINTQEDAEPIFWGRAKLLVIEPGSNNVNSPAPEDGFISMEQADLRYLLKSGQEEIYLPCKDLPGYRVRLSIVVKNGLPILSWGDPELIS